MVGIRVICFRVTVVEDEEDPADSGMGIIRTVRPDLGHDEFGADTELLDTCRIGRILNHSGSCFSKLGTVEWSMVTFDLECLDFGAKIKIDDGLDEVLGG